LGLAYEEGIGVEQDNAAATKWYFKAGEQGHAEAQYHLGLMFSQGLQDYAEAARWFLKAAEKGIADAQFNIGLILEEGRGVKRDSSSAEVWYTEAAAQGHEEAQSRLNKMKSKQK
jgi:TPR repeat protein